MEPIADMNNHVKKLMNFEEHNDEFSSLYRTVMTMPNAEFETPNFYADPTVVYGVGPQAVPVPPERVYKFIKN